MAHTPQHPGGPMQGLQGLQQPVKPQPQMPSRQGGPMPQGMPQGGGMPPGMNPQMAKMMQMKQAQQRPPSQASGFNKYASETDPREVVRSLMIAGELERTKNPFPQQKLTKRDIETRVIPSLFGKDFKQDITGLTQPKQNQAGFNEQWNQMRGGGQPNVQR